MSSSRIDPLKMKRQSKEVVIASEGHADWIAGTERPLVLGESVLCTDGLAQLSRILGKTGDGSRLLELSLPDRPKHHPFFAAASNVLIAPTV